jgi:hypothetical protein
MVWDPGDSLPELWNFSLPNTRPTIFFEKKSRADTNGCLEITRFRNCDKFRYRLSQTTARSDISLPLARVPHVIPELALGQTLTKRGLG